MNVSFFDNRRVRQVLTVLMLFGALTCIFPPFHPAFRWWADQAVFVALGYLLAALFFLIIDNARLMFVCLGCSAAICFFKNELGDSALGTKDQNFPAYSTGFRPQPCNCTDTIFLKTDTPDEPSKTRQ